MRTRSSYATPNTPESTTSTQVATPSTTTQSSVASVASNQWQTQAMSFFGQCQNQVMSLFGHSGSLPKSIKKPVKIIPVDKLVCPNTLRLEREDGETTRIPAHNYYLTGEGAPRDHIRNLATEALTRSPKSQGQLNDDLTEAYARYEMSFRVKNHDTGMYDKIFNVPVNGLIAPIKESHFNGLVKSTEPVMRALRVLLQNIYSAEEWTPEALGITELPVDDQEKVIATLKESIYFEKSVVGSEMKDYPFLAVAGFDAAVGNLEKIDPVFFEFNLGTPSGMSNNAQLMQLIAEKDPALFNTIRHHLPEDNSFQILRDAIESNAKAWTGKSDGICVVVSPGVYNGAHPDVASISMFTGMPLVRPQDLYQDAAGAIRLNTGDPAADPQVTGIYSRAEESFFLQSHEDGIYMKSPAFSDNKELCEKLGVDLTPGILYQFQYNRDGEITGVDLDSDGNPLPARAFDRIGQDPARPGAASGSFLQAIKSRNLYFSGLGGRTVDDKRVFQAVAEFLAPAYVTDTPTIGQSDEIARPPRTLRLNEYETFYSDPKLENYVIKEPDRSGGDGIYLMVNLTTAERLDVVKQVRANPEHFIVQEFAEFALMTIPEKDKSSSETVFGTQANDWRLFIIMDGEGNVQSGPNSLVLRTAQPGSASTNTSQGGGYGIGVVLSDTPRLRPLDATSIPAPERSSFIGAERREMLHSFLKRFNDYTIQSDPRSSMVIPLNGNLTFFAHQQRELMDILGRETSGLMSVVRDYNDGKISQKALHQELLKYRVLFYNHDARPIAGLDQDIEKILAEYAPCPLTPLKAGAGKPVLSKAQLSSMLEVAPLDDGDIKVREVIYNNDLHEIVEAGRYLSSEDPAVQSYLDLVTQLGGEVRATQSKSSSDSQLSSAYANPYFRVTAEGKPVVGIDLTQEFALTSLAHEVEHLAMFCEIKTKLQRKNPGLSEIEAALAAQEETLTTANRVIGERRSVHAEIAVENNDESPFNRGTRQRATSVINDGYVARMVYPEVEGLRDALHRATWSGEAIDEAQVKSLTTNTIKFALEARNEAYNYYMNRVSELASKGSEDDLIEAGRCEVMACLVFQKDIFSEILKYDLNRFESDETVTELYQLFKEGVEEFDRSRFSINSQDEAWLTAKAEA